MSEDNKQTDMFPEALQNHLVNLLEQSSDHQRFAELWSAYKRRDLWGLGFHLALLISKEQQEELVLYTYDTPK